MESSPSGNRRPKKVKADILPDGVGLSSPTQQILCAAWTISPPTSPRKLRRVPPERMGEITLVTCATPEERAACNSCERFCCKTKFMASMSVAPIAELCCSETCPMSGQRIAGRESWGHTFALNTSLPVSSNRHLFNARRNRRSNWLPRGAAHLLGLCYCARLLVNTST